MTRTITATELRDRWSETLATVDAGDPVIVTRYGVPVARLDPPDPSPRMTPEEAMAALRAIRTRVTLGDDLTIRGLIEEGRRY